MIAETLRISHTSHTRRTHALDCAQACKFKQRPVCVAKQQLLVRGPWIAEPD